MKRAVLCARRAKPRRGVGRASQVLVVALLALLAFVLAQLAKPSGTALGKRIIGSWRNVGPSVQGQNALRFESDGTIYEDGETPRSGTYRFLGSETERSRTDPFLGPAAIEIRWKNGTAETQEIKFVGEDEMSLSSKDGRTSGYLRESVRRPTPSPIRVYKPGT